jgi:hypothetical protein
MHAAEDRPKHVMIEVESCPHLYTGHVPEVVEKAVEMPREDRHATDVDTRLCNIMTD